MIERINLIESEPFKFTYRKVMTVVALAVTTCAVFYGFQILRIYLKEKGIAKVQSKIAMLESERQSLIKVTPTKVDTGPFSDIKNQIMVTPPWAEFVIDIGNRLPAGTYLTSMSAATDQKISSGNDVKDAKKKEAKTEVKKGGISLSGISKDADEMSQFVNELENSLFVDSVTLKNSEKVEKGFDFDIECQLSATFDIKNQVK